METGGIGWAVVEPAQDEVVRRCSTTCTYCWNLGRRPEQLSQGKLKARVVDTYAPSTREDELHCWKGGRPAFIVMVCWSCGAKEVVVSMTADDTPSPRDGGGSARARRGP